MKNKIFFSTLILVSLSLLSFDLPKSWFIAGSEPKKYEMGIDKGAGHNGKNAATILSKDKKINGFGTLMQDCLPDNYLGKRIRMSGFIKSKDVDDKAGLWLRVDQSNSNNPLSFDNMLDRPIKGTTEWKKYEIVLDVPVNAINIAYGALLVGTGQIWFDDITFEIVDNSVTTTGRGKENLMPSKEPINLDFEK